MTNKPRSTPGSIEIHDLAETLNGEIETLAHELLGAPNPKLSTANQLRFGTKGSLAVEIDGPNRGKWFDHEVGEGGAALELIMHRQGCGLQDAVRWAREWSICPSVPRPAKADNLSAGRRDAEIVDKTIRGSVSIMDTPAEAYLRRRGITAALPANLRYRKNAFDQYGALVVPILDEAGSPVAVQQIYVTDDGGKAPVAVQKRINKACDNWAATGEVSFPGTGTAIFCEGVETALSIWQATKQSTTACLNIGGLANRIKRQKGHFIVARDADAPESKATKQLQEALNHAVQGGARIDLASPPLGKDFNDVLSESGDAAVLESIKKAVPVETSGLPERGSGGALSSFGGAILPPLTIGSDVEIARLLEKQLSDEFGPVIFDEGQFWVYSERHWQAVSEQEMRRRIQAFDGAKVEPSVGAKSIIKLNSLRSKSILQECAIICAELGFFRRMERGINCLSGFIRFSATGVPTLEPHSREHRVRYINPGSWTAEATSEPPAGSLLRILLDGIFEAGVDGEAKRKLLAEVAGIALTGQATRLPNPRAVLLVGQSAANGKSQVLELLRGVVPAGASASITAEKLGNDRYVAELAGKLLNASDELSSKAIASDLFKAVITGDPIQGRPVYQQPIEVRSQAQCVFATNILPSFAGGMDRGVIRRLLPIEFNRTIPLADRVEKIGERIASEEPELLLALAVDGASRVFKQRGFTEPDSSKGLLEEWIYTVDPVAAWLRERTSSVLPGACPDLRTAVAYQDFSAWAEANGYRNADRLPSINGFTQRVKATGVGTKRKSDGGYYIGLTLKGR